MLRKLLLIFVLFLSFFTYNISLANPADRQIERQQIEREIEQEKLKKALEKRDQECEASNDCLDKSNFTIPVSSMFNFGGGLSSNITGNSTEEKINSTLGYIIQKLMIALGIISLFVMTIGAGYIILYHGQDDLLSKGKNIFMAGIISLVVALSSYYIVSLVRYLIFT